jgi:hypothetical protein
MIIISQAHQSKHIMAVDNEAIFKYCLRSDIRIEKEGMNYVSFIES